ncbi:MAG TPA: S8 family serine peptidase [Bryobacteraceae bacterium]|nr:S8 family serine peptidase [Bryobacteraceae bacterium]
MHACRIAILDSGINPAHPHVGNVAGGVNISALGQFDDFLDRLGHGTAVAGAIHEKAQAAQILAIKIFDKKLTATIDQLVTGIEWALLHDAQVINLSLGTTNPNHREKLTPVIESAIQAGVRVVSALHLNGVPCFPGSLPGVLGVEADASVPREEVRITGDRAIASPYPRPIPGLPPERNLSGISFAVANVSGYLCAQITSKMVAEV